ncbi:MAG: helix-turn-helix domain-containing protein [Candidatus Limnocylindria bacterium]
MRDLELGRLLRMLRIRRAWRLRDMAGRCGLSRATIGRHELGSIGSVSVIRTHAAALDIRVEWRVVGRALTLPACWTRSTRPSSRPLPLG